MRQAKDNASHANVSSIDKAFAIIDYLHQKGGEASIAEISKELGMHKSTVYRILNAVKAAGYIYQNEDTLNYALSVRFYQIGMRLQNNGEFLRAYTRYARALNEKYNEVIAVGTRELAVNDIPRYVELYGFRSRHSLTRRMETGEYSLSHCTASGKCLLAFSGERYLSRFDGCELQRLTQYTITDWSLLKLELEKIRRQGYAVDNEECELGLNGIAVPLFDRNDRVIGEMSLTLPVERFRMMDVNKAIEDLKAVSNLRLEV